MGDLSEHFSSWEFRCRCCGRGQPDPRLVQGLEKLRTKLGRPIHVNSGARCSKHNREVGGVPDSQHLCEAVEQGTIVPRLATAADIVAYGDSVKRTFHAALELHEFSDGGIGLYPSRGFVHLDVRGYPARWYEGNLQIPSNYYQGDGA